mgnify:FL=1
MNPRDFWQLLPILALVVYIFYTAYYYAIPTYHLRILWLIAKKKYHCHYIKITDGRITVKFEKDGEEKVIDRLLEIDVPPRFMVSALCSKFKGVLKEIRSMQ